MPKVSVLLLAASTLVALPAAAEEPSGPEAAKAAANGAAIAASSNHNLGNIHGGLRTNGEGTAGLSREVDLAASKTAMKPTRPAATPRALRRMNSERVLASIDTNVRACAALSTSHAPTALMMRVSIAPGGEVEGAQLAPGARVPAPLLTCVVNAINAARFGTPGAAGALVVVPVTVPGRTTEASSVEPGDSKPSALEPAVATAAPAAPADAKPDSVAAAPKP